MVPIMIQGMENAWKQLILDVPFATHLGHTWAI